MDQRILFTVFGSLQLCENTFNCIQTRLRTGQQIWLQQKNHVAKGAASIVTRHFRVFKIFYVLLPVTSLVLMLPLLTLMWVEPSRPWNLRVANAAVFLAISHQV